MVQMKSRLCVFTARMRITNPAQSASRGIHVDIAIRIETGGGLNPIVASAALCT